MSSAQEPHSGSNPTIKDFVLQQAHQRAFEIGVLGLKDYEKQRARIIAQRKQSQHAEFDKKHKDAEASVRIHKSALINGSRMKKMMARHADLLKIVAETQVRIRDSIVSNRNQYANLLQQLVVQGLIKMLEPVVYIRCLQRDQAIVRSIIEPARAQFRALIAQEGIDESVASVDLRLDEKFTLEQRSIGQDVEDKIAKGDENGKCFGGVVLTSEDGLIVCKNTLDSRIELAYQGLLPGIRRVLFS